MTKKHPAITIAIWGSAMLLSLLVSAGFLANQDFSFWDSIKGSAKTVVMVLAGLLAAVACILGLVGLLRQFHRWFPVDRAYELTYTQSDWLEFQRHSWISTLVYLGQTIVFAFLFYQILMLLPGWYARLVPARYLIPVSQRFWLIPAITFALSLAIPITYHMYRWKMKDRFPRYIAFQNQRFGYDQRRAGLTMMVFGLLLSLGLVIIGLNLYLRIDESGLAINRFFGIFEERHRYVEIVNVEERIITRPDNSETEQDKIFVLQFQDSHQWRSSSYGTRPIPENIQDALAYISRASGLPIKRVITTSGQ